MNITQVQNIQLSPDNNLVSILDDRYVLKPDIHSDVDDTVFHPEKFEISYEAKLIMINSIIIVALTIPVLGMLFAFLTSTKEYLTTHGAWLDSWPSTPLMVASYFGNYMIAEEIMHILLESDADPNARNDFGNTALHFAACNDNTKIVGSLLLYEAYINARNRDKNTPLHIAVEKQNPYVVGALLKSGARTELKNNERDTALHIAARKGNSKIVDLLLKHGAKTELKNLAKDTAVLIAAGNGNPEVMKLLLRNGANPNVKNLQNETPLLIAVILGHSRIVELLLNHGADIKEGNSYDTQDGWTLLHIAAYQGNPEVAGLLLKNGARTDLTTVSGQTAMDLAVQNENGRFYEVVDLLKNLPK